MQGVEIGHLSSHTHPPAVRGQHKRTMRQGVEKAQCDGGSYVGLKGAMLVEHDNAMVASVYYCNAAVF